MNKDEFDKYLQGKKDEYRQILDIKNKVEDSIKNMKDDNENFQRQISKKENLINRIENDLKMIPDGFVYKTDSTLNYRNKPFIQIKGFMILPVQSVDIVFDFGRTIDPATKTVLYNNGVDVSIVKGSDVKCVADGIVEDIRYYPLYGKTIIINHNNNYRTVYAILENINVALNERVPAVKIIAKKSENLNGQSFHFEMWNDVVPLDPKQWVKRGALVSVK
jgi:murein DD-endopeptidase MepM/ murein hydrolase activator NlpD